MPNQFRDYVTGQAFSLNLRKSHIWVLAHIEAGDYLNRAGVDIAAAPRHDIFVPAVHGLIERGLVEHNPKWNKNKKPAYILTPAGHHVLALLKIAELVYPARQKELA